MPHQSETRWQHLGTTSDVAEDGQMTASFHVVEMHSGEEFTISVTGRGAANGGLFMGALLVAAETMRTKIGAEMPSLRHVSKLKTN
jgi:hypothetical protein